MRAARLASTHELETGGGKKRKRISVDEETRMRSDTDAGLALLKRSPCTSDAETVKFKQPFLTCISGGKMPKGNKMVPPSEYTQTYEVAPHARSMQIAMANAVHFGLRYAGLVASAFAPNLNELQGRPMLQALLAGLFMAVPVDGYTMSSKLATDVLLVEKGRLVKKESLSPQRRESLTRWKTEILIEAKDEYDEWKKRLVIQDKFPFHKEDFCEAIMSACNHQVESSGVHDRLYVQVWDEWVRNGILDSLGRVKVSNGLVTEESYRAYQTNVAKMRRYFGVHFPEESYKLCPQTLEAMQQRFKGLNDQFVDDYSLNLPDGKYLVAVFYQDSETVPLPTRSTASLKQTGDLFQSLLRIVIGDQVLEWDWEKVSKVIQERERHLLSKQAEMVKYSLTDSVTVFHIDSMGSRYQGYPGGCWKVKESSAAWDVNITWQTWLRQGSNVTLSEGWKRLDITEGGDNGRVVQIWFPEVLDPTKSMMIFGQNRLQFHAAKVERPAHAFT